jgi:predicted RNase H-like HicB family nuclease
MAEFTEVFEKGEQYYLGYCPELPGANGQIEPVSPP